MKIGWTTAEDQSKQKRSGLPDQVNNIASIEEVYLKDTVVFDVTMCTTTALETVR